MHVDRKLALRLALIAALPEPVMLERLRRLSVAELIVSAALRHSRVPMQGRCKVQQFMLAEGRAARTGRSRRLAARLMRELRNDPPSMYQTRCQCAASRQTAPPCRSRSTNSWPRCWCRKVRWRASTEDQGELEARRVEAE